MNPVFMIILNDAKGINPNITRAKSFRNLNCVLQRLWQGFCVYTLSEFFGVFKKKPDMVPFTLAID
jgi:hypothetical protein